MIESIRKCLHFIPPGTRWRWAVLVGLSFGVSVVEAIGAVLVLTLLRLITDPGTAVEIPILGSVDGLLPSLSADEQLTVIGITAAVFFVLRGAMVIAQLYLQFRVAGNTGVALADRLLRGYLAMPFTWHVQTNSSRLIRSLNESTEVVARQAFAPIVSLLSDLAIVITLVTVLIAAAPGVTLLAGACMGPVVFVIMRLVQPRVGTMGALAQHSIRAGLQTLSQTFESVRDVKLYDREEFFRGQFRRHKGDYVRAIYISTTLSNLPRIAIETVFVLLLVVFLIVADGNDPTASGTVPVLGLFAYAMLRILPAVNRIMLNLTNLRFATAAINNVHDDLRLIDEQSDAGARAIDGPRLPFATEIALEGVGYRYPATEVDVLVDVDLVIPKGSFVGVVGPTGSGKSTLIDTVMGILPPTDGVITVDGVPIRDDLAAWQRNIAVVPQLILLHDDTLRRNIAFGVDDDAIDDQLVRHALSQAQLDDFLARLPDGLDTMVGEHGLMISGGQRQRLALARALYREPDVLVLDEGTAALDPTTEMQVIDTLRRLKGSHTLIMVSHRMRTVVDCDFIVMLHEGRIVRKGTYSELGEQPEEFPGLLL